MFPGIFEKVLKEVEMDTLNINNVSVILIPSPI